jgi:acetolactate synthase-1/2/3 large subunit
MDVVRRLLPADAVLTNGAGNFASWIAPLSPLPRAGQGPQNAAGPYQRGHGLWRARRHWRGHRPAGRTVFTIAGDGDFMMNGQELATAAQFGAKTIIVLVNNGTYGTIRMHQEREYPQHVSGSTLVNPDFVLWRGPLVMRPSRSRLPKNLSPPSGVRWRPKQGTVIELMLSADVITTRGTLSAITSAAKARLTK